MKTMGKSLAKWMMLVAIAGTMLLSPIMHEVMADPWVCSGNNITACAPNSGACSTDNGGGVCTDLNLTNSTTTSTTSSGGGTAPEMSDYLAMAFIAMSGVMIYLRRRALSR